MSNLTASKTPQFVIPVRRFTRRLVQTLLGAIACVLLSLSSQPAHATYTVTDLGVPSGSGYTASYAQGINSSGVVVGYCTDSDGTSHAFVWNPSTTNGTSGTMTDLSSILGIHESVAYAVNNSGYICGYYSASVGFGFSSYHHAFVLQPSGSSYTLVDLTGSSSTNTGVAYALNNLSVTSGTGQVVGQQSGTAVLWQDQTNGATTTTLVTPTGMILGSNITSSAQGIDDHYDGGNDPNITGWTYDPATNTAPENTFLWSAGGTLQVLCPDQSHGYYSQGLAINSGGGATIVGWIQQEDGSAYPAYEWDGASGGTCIFTDTIWADTGWGGNLSSSANAVNNYGYVVGYCNTDPSGTMYAPSVYPGYNHAFRWSSGTPCDLNCLYLTSSWEVYTNATGINDYSGAVRGQIVGYGLNSNGDTHAFLITP